jgi:hypothetical protein
MLSIKSKTAPDLEQTLADRRADLDRARADYRECRLCFEDAKNLLAGSETPENVAAHRVAMEDVQSAAVAVNVATEGVKASERVLDLSRTMPVRHASAKRIDEAVSALKKAPPALRLSLASMCEALVGASFQEVAAVWQAGGMFSSWMHRANDAGCSGDLERFIAELEVYRDAIISGEKPATLASTLHEQRTGQRKAS